MTAIPQSAPPDPEQTQRVAGLQAVVDRWFPGAHEPEPTVRDCGEHEVAADVAR